jgi:hypothetical protein
VEIDLVAEITGIIMVVEAEEVVEEAEVADEEADEAVIITITTTIIITMITPTNTTDPALKATGGKSEDLGYFFPKNIIKETHNNLYQTGVFTQFIHQAKNYQKFKSSHVPFYPI